MDLPKEFLKRLKEADLDESVYETRARKCVRANTLKNSKVDVIGEKVPWFDAFWVDKLSDYKNSIKNGSVIVQDAASMMPVLSLKPKRGEAVLDLCAAPGMKTVLMCELMENKGVLIANDFNSKRVKRLFGSVRRYGMKNCKVIVKNGVILKFENNEQFDKVLIDAPCSGTGIVNKIEKTMELWSAKRVESLIKVQRKLLKNGLSLLKDGGELVYCTCSIDVRENEEVVEFVLNEVGGELVETKRIDPCKHGTNFIFYAKIKK